MKSLGWSSPGRLCSSTLPRSERIQGAEARPDPHQHPSGPELPASSLGPQKRQRRFQQPWRQTQTPARQPTADALATESRAATAADRLDSDDPDSADPHRHLHFNQLWEEWGEGGGVERKKRWIATEHQRKTGRRGSVTQEERQNFKAAVKVWTEIWGHFRNKRNKETELRQRSSARPAIPTRQKEAQ